MAIASTPGCVDLMESATDLVLDRADEDGGGPPAPRAAR